MASTAGGSRGRGRATLKLSENTLLSGIRSLPGAVNRAAAFVMLKNEAPAENYMKTHAPWTDRTTNARNGLAARYTGSEKGVHEMVLFHQVDYGIWLEVKDDGKYAIILPTIQEMGPRVMKDLVNILDRIKGEGSVT